MGRRKIEIKAIKDDRNRSVTFLKRKGGLFKKAHELSVLCSVDVAVIIFGNNKKLYEYSSSDIGEILQRYNFYGGPNEHKGPADFNGKGGDDDDDDDDMGVSPPSHHSQEPPMLPPQFQNQPGFQHIRHHTPSASPPVGNGAPFHHVQRGHTPQPQIGSRPSSRNALRRSNSNLVPPHMAQPPAANGYAYMPQPPLYNPQNGPMMPQHPQHPQHPQYSQQHPQQHPHQPPMQQPPMQQPPMQQPPMQQPPPPFQHPGPPQHQHHQLQQVYMEDQRRSMPPAFPQQERQAPGPSATPPQPQHQPTPQQLPPQRSPPQQQQQQQQQDEPQPPPQTMLEPPVKRLSVKSRSIFTPIDESRSILSQHWASSTSSGDTSKGEAAAGNRSQSVDVGSVQRANAAVPTSQPQRAQTHDKNRNASQSSVSETFTPPSRTNSAQLGAKRPRLKVQIPDEPSDGGGSATGGSSPPGSQDVSSHPSRRGGVTEGSHSSGVVLPPPSPSAGALLSAGASGPPNPFARPHPPSQAAQANGNDRDRDRNNIDTPVSALPSRFMSNDFLPSPSSFFYPEWNMRGGDSNTLPSPLNFATPVVGFGPSFLREDSAGGANGGGAIASQVGMGKRKSPETEEGSEPKRSKHEI